MLFNDFRFALFFGVVFSIYWLLDHHKKQNYWLLLASYFFYGCWNWRFLSLILLSTLVDYYCGKNIHKLDDSLQKRKWLSASVFVNLGLLGFFKYFNFFIASFKDLFLIFGIELDSPMLNILLPVGISFYTFQTMSYTLDVYRGKLKPVENFFDFALFVSFFPQLVAGPIERAERLVPQVLERRRFSFLQMQDGLFLIFFGLFKKVFIADNMSMIVDQVFAGNGNQNGFLILIGLYAFSFQIYCDFSGYSDIARGVSKMLGFDLMVNFRLPYFAVNPSDFWRRWHISLSTWLRDYLYIPLGGNKHGTLNTYRNLMLTMLLGGLWHEASWTFVVWGFYHGALLAVHRLVQPTLKSIINIKTALQQKVWSQVRIVAMFHLVCFGWLFFRAESMTQAFQLCKGMLFNLFVGSFPKATIKEFVFFAIILLSIQVYQHLKNELNFIIHLNSLQKGLVFGTLTYCLILYGVSAKTFIYFQF